MTRSILERIAEDESVIEIIYHPFTIFGAAYCFVLGIGLFLDVASQIQRRQPQYEYRTTFVDVNSDGVKDRITERRELPYGVFESYDVLDGKRFAALIKWEEENARH